MEKTNPRLLDWLRERRWFGEKARDNLRASVADVIPIEWRDRDGHYAVARVRVEAPGATPAYYQLFLRDGAPFTEDVLEDDEFKRGLLEAFAAGCTFERDGRRWIIESMSDAPLRVPADAAITVARVEQSNTSVFVGNLAVLKMFRRLSPGIHPDIEVSRFLTIDRRFVHTPVLLGTVHFVDDQGMWASGMLQELVPGATDAWSYALECAREWFAAGDEAGAVPFVHEAERLGVITRAMHDTLASGDPGSAFERNDASPADVAEWIDATVAMARKALGSAGRANEADDAERRIQSLGASVGTDAGARIRIHGDYHLGQVLRSVTNAFLIVDFEGEPARPLDERRRPHSPLRDVGGMLRSFAYVAATLGGKNADRRQRWEHTVREAFLRGYFEAEGEREILPRARENADRLLSLLELEKAFYELQYELDHRPDWAWIPLQAIDRFLDVQIPRSARDDSGKARDDR